MENNQTTEIQKPIFRELTSTEKFLQIVAENRSTFYPGGNLDGIQMTNQVIRQNYRRKRVNKED